MHGWDAYLYGYLDYIYRYVSMSVCIFVYMYGLYICSIMRIYVCMYLCAYLIYPRCVRSLPASRLHR
jgi:hypothetical protein